MGLAICPFMPDATAAATSSLKALAVMARMGMEFASGCTEARMARVAS